MKQSYVLLIGFLFSFSAFGEKAIDQEDLIIAETKKEVQAKASSEADPRVVILNNQNQQVDQKAAHDQNAQVSNQPVVRVVGIPTSSTYATELKKSRKEAEVETEQKIVEKLESSRLRDEQERLKKLFGDTPKQKTVVAPTVPSTPITVKATDESEIYSETVEEEDEDSIYVGFHGGQSSNLTRALENVTSYGSFGISFGAFDESGLILESSFYYSQHQVENADSAYLNNSDIYGLTDVHQLTGVLSLKYTPLTNRFKPYAGVAVSYNYRLYSDYYVCEYGSQYCDSQAKSDSIDLGADVGVNFELSKKVSIGFNLLINVLHLYDNRSDWVRDSYSEDLTLVKLEETNWIIASINAKLYF